MSEPETRVAPWEDFVLRLIAIWKISHGIFFTAVGFGLISLRHHDLAQFLNDYVVSPYHLNPEGRMVDWLLDQASKTTPHMLYFWGKVAFFYAALFYAEGIGLYMRKQWAEYLVVIVTASLLPLEMMGIHHRIAWVAIGGNILIVAYLIHRLILDHKLKKQQRLEAEARVAAAPSAAPASVPLDKSVVNEVP